MKNRKNFCKTNLFFNLKTFATGSKMDELQQLFQSITGKHVALIGDIYLDEYIDGIITGISNEGPIPLVQSRQRTFVPNAAAHAALLMAGFGLQVHLFGLVGEDVNGKEVLRLLQEKGIDTSGVLKDKHFSTNSQTRISVQGSRYPRQDILHINTPPPFPIADDQLDDLILHLEKIADQCQAIVVFDKNGHVITRDAVDRIKHVGNTHGLLLIGDSEHQTALFKNFTAITPNELEAREVVGPGYPEVDNVGTELLSQLDCNTVFMTRGAEGISIYEQQKCIHLPTRVKEVFDVTGAGETVLAAVTAGLVAGKDSEQVARLANMAAGIAVGKPGLADVSIEEILDFDKRQSAELTAEKLVTESQLKAILQKVKAEGKRVVWTNGCFDIMHVGHILYLEKARSLGDLLVVGLNSDASVRQSKGPARPIVTESQRAKLLTALSCVDYVIIFDDKTPLKLLDTFKPDVYAKGGDYTIDTINQDERRLVESYGGEIALLPGLEGASTTNLIEKILQSYKQDKD